MSSSEFIHIIQSHTRQGNIIQVSSHHYLIMINKLGLNSFLEAIFVENIFNNISRFTYQRKNSVLFGKDSLYYYSEASQTDPDLSPKMDR